MSSLGINFSGLASGLDTRAIIDALLAVERRPIALMERQKADHKRRKDLFGELEGLLETLQDKADGIRRLGGFLEKKATVDGEDQLTASAGRNAVNGSYQIKVNALAKAQISQTNGKPDRTTNTYGNGLLIFDFGNGRTVDVTIGNGSLEGIADAINSRAGLGVRAQVVDTGAATDPYKLVLTGEVGSSNSFTVTVDEGDPPLHALVGELNANVSAATDASLEINGVAVTRKTNTISDLIDGVTLSLKSTHGANESSTLTVDTDTTETSAKVRELVEAYNAVLDFVSEQGKVDEEGQTSSLLFGDSTVRSIRSAMRSIVGSSVSGTGNTAYSLLVQVGIKSDTDGRLTFEQSKFEEALGNDAAAVERMFAADGTGVAARLFDQLDIYLDPIDGAIFTRKDGVDRMVRDIDRRIDAAEDRLELYERQLVDKFAAMETLLGRLQGQGGALGAFSLQAPRNNGN